MAWLHVIRPGCPFMNLGGSVQTEFGPQDMRNAPLLLNERPSISWIVRVQCCKFRCQEGNCNSKVLQKRCIKNIEEDLPVEEYENCFKKWIDHLKRCVQVGGEDFEGQDKRN